MLDHLPIFGICGFSGSGKTTLLAAVVPRLVAQGLTVVVVKHDVHGIDRDVSGKDSDRLFQAGADVVVQGPAAALERRATSEDLLPLTSIVGLATRYDLVLVEGYKAAPWQKCWLACAGEDGPPAGVENVAAVLPWDSDRVATLQSLLENALRRAQTQTPLFGCVLIGGHSSRMGSPKHLLPSPDSAPQTWLHRTVALMGGFVQQVVIAGRGAVPEDLSHLPRLPDPPGVEGPMAGLLAAMRWAPAAAWLLAACDLPHLTEAALQWLLAQRRPGVWALMPQRAESSAVEPLLAWYDFRWRDVLEEESRCGRQGLQHLARHRRAHLIAVPPALDAAWHDADTPQAVTSS